MDQNDLQCRFSALEYAIQCTQLSAEGSIDKVLATANAFYTFLKGETTDAL